MLCQATCIENESERLLNSEIPTEQQILGWLECLVRRKKDKKMIELFHLIIEEFLQMDSEKVFSAVARKYLVSDEDGNYLIQACLIYLMHDDFGSMSCSNVGEVRSLTETYPLYSYFAYFLCKYVYTLAVGGVSMNGELQSIMRRFLSISVDWAFRLWAKWLTGTHYESLKAATSVKVFFTPLHFAVLTGLVDEVEKLLKLELDSNSTIFAVDRTRLAYTFLHLTLLAAQIDTDAWFFSLSDENNTIVVQPIKFVATDSEPD